ncbi:DUF1302 domain-containing protein [Pseudomonas alkylphenolica]|uniref:DUF1302 domain-containing protein n=1 Tax=Pseudomonas alkylphenolica TaxID=237609 RepID=A0A443ZHJ3_9PSED|nr:DUF1302 family protein [Pseudomonas alkylphenolica]RWU18301.1 DUF1302 domain-containing protein [Pseudomonas alkylphenolica]
MTYRQKKCARLPVALGIVLAVGALSPSKSWATFSWESADGLKLDWNNALRYSAMFRVDKRDSELLSNPNLDDGDQNFSTGLVSNRGELFSELDLVHPDGIGARVSASAWYDTVYNRDNDNPGVAGGAYPNQLSSAPDEFTDSTRDQHGRDVELRDAFVFGRLQLGGTELSGRLGQHSLVWGESLFFANNAIAGAQSPFDTTRLLDDPTAEAKEFVLPVPQVSAQWQLSDTLSIGAYYQFRYVHNRIPGSGSYFSVSDIVGAGAERLVLDPATGLSAPKESDRDAKDSGQFGLQLRWQVGEFDLGFYALQFHDKDFQQVTRMGQPFGPFGPVLPTGYYLAYQEDTQLYGFSASRSFGDLNLALEASIRKDQSLATTHAVDTSALGGAVPDNRDHPAYAVGDTAHINVSTIWTVPRTALWNEANLAAEVAWTRLLKCKQNCDDSVAGAAALDPNITRDAWAMRAVFEPMYRQALLGWDISVPMGVGFTPNGSRNALGPSAVPAENGGDFTIGVSGLYMNAWDLNLAYTRFFGSAGSFLDESNSYSYKQARADRDFIAFTVRRSF